MTNQAEKIARRTTADNKAVILWSDGVITFAFGAAIKGVGKAREPWARDADLAAGWAFMGEACLFDAKEVSTAIKAIRKAFRDPYHGRPGFKGGEHAADYRACMVLAVEAAG
jgi:hypothetical protein